MRSATAVLALIFVVACKGGGGDSGDTDDTNDTNTTGVEPGTLDDVFSLEANDACNSFDGYEHAGATSYFVGVFELSGEDVSGFEAAVLFPNPSLEVDDPTFTQCEVWWQVIGTKGEPTIGSADYSIAIHATRDDNTTSCIPEYATTLDAAYDVTYNVIVDGSGNADLFFADSGNQLGSGDATDAEVRYSTDYSCQIY